MDKNRKSSNKSAKNLQDKKPLLLLGRMSTKSQKYLLSKSRNTLEQTRDTLLSNKISKNKKYKQRLTNDSYSPQITQHPPSQNTLLLENRLMTQYQNRLSSQGKSLSQKQKSVIKGKVQELAKIKQRLSLKDKKPKLDHNESFLRYYQTVSTVGGQMQSVTKERQNIQKQLKKICKKTKVEKKDILKISNQYEKLLDRFAFTEIPINQPFEDDRPNNVHTINVSCPKDSNFAEQQNIVQETENKKKKVVNLQLKNLRKLGIQDYNDEFMSHYEELSQSWKRDIDIQKRY